jgi:anaerobic ribonucleoside-triphosphate reductase activating protein
MGKTFINLYMKAPSTEALGPFRRFAIWVQGCNKHCKGCIAKDSWNIDAGEKVDIQKLAEEILRQPDIEGITISGGEPFLQENALASLVEFVKSKRDIGVIIYTGMKYTDVAKTRLIQCCDLLIDGEYIEELNDGKSLRGSSNQNVIPITGRYRTLVEDIYNQQGRKVEFIVRDGHMDMIGIPPKKIEEQIK